MKIPHIKGDSILIRHNHPDTENGHLSLRPTHVILAGNGSIDGGTAPLIRAIKEFTGKDVTAESAASVTSVLAQRFKDQKYFALKDLAEIIENVGSLNAYFSEYYTFKQLISKCYRKDFINKSLNIRKSSSLAECLGLTARENIGVITLNWDSCFWESLEFENVIQLHGTAAHEESIVLPSEFVNDEEIAEILENHGLKIECANLRFQLQRIFRGNFRRPLLCALQTAGFWLQEASTIIIWGVAFHPYDSEVCQLAWNMGRQTLESKQIIIINPSEKDRAVSRFLLSSHFLKITEFCY